MTDIVVEQRIAAPPEKVYEYLTDAKKWTLWLGAAADLDAAPGGVFSIVMGNGMNARGQFVELVPHRRVVFTWGWVDRPGIPPGSTTVTIDLIADDTGTRVVLTHRDLPDDEASPHETGWKQYLPALSKVAGEARGVTEAGHLQQDVSGVRGEGGI